MSKKSCLIALDIDGTLAPERQPIPEAVVNYINAIKKEHYLVFMTGRTCRFALSLLQDIHLPYYLSVQNGAAVIKMPEKTVIYRKYLTSDLFSYLDNLFQGEKNDYLIETGVENDDQCYFRENKYSQEQLKYIHFREELSKEKWISVTTYENLPFQSFPLIKCFGEKLFLEKIASQLNLFAPVIHDPFKENGYILMATELGVSKGSALRALREMLDPNLYLVAAGDDYNDESMLEIADFGIIMETAPKDLFPKADFIAPSAIKHGIINALSQVIS